MTDALAVGTAIDTAHLLHAWHEADPRPSLVVTPDRQVLWANTAARRFLQQSEAVGVAGSSLLIHDPRQHHALGEQLAAATTVPRCWAVRDADGRHSAIFCIQRLGESLDACGVRVLRQEAPAYAQFREVYGLTGAEERVLLLLLAGQVAADVARASGASLQTVRAQIKAIYAKVGVSSREALLHAANRFRIT